MTNIAFVDTETTHLNAEIGEAWEVAVILREDGKGDTELLWQFRPDVAKADPESLRIGGYPRRFIVPEGMDAAFIDPEGTVRVADREWAINEIWTALSGAVLVGSNPGFDDRFLRKLLGPGSAQWHYRPVDIATLVAGARFGMAKVLCAALPLVGSKDVPTFPFSSREMSRFVGVEPPGDDVAHTALGDARWARDVFDAVTGGAF
ncbi:hypothetical protein [Streptomyces sp. NPDC058812]|uniref:3'-5' exonuclease n=1 Tax=unclassified Streptomyces TaxID=2593676 RepID=UPI0036D1E45E